MFIQSLQLLEMFKLILFEIVVSVFLRNDFSVQFLRDPFPSCLKINNHDELLGWKKIGK